jgi:hypothetical protein
MINDNFFLIQCIVNDNPFFTIDFHNFSEFLISRLLVACTYCLLLLLLVVEYIQEPLIIIVSVVGSDRQPLLLTLRLFLRGYLADLLSKIY